MDSLFTAFYDRDPVDLALDWNDPSDMNHGLKPVAVVVPANDKRPGGDWEAGVMSPEECLCRRSTLFANLTTPGENNCASSNYPLPTKAGIYSGNVVVFRDGPEKYEAWQEYKGRWSGLVMFHFVLFVSNHRHSITYHIRLPGETAQT